jgi:hypothetical protein
MNKSFLLLFFKKEESFFFENADAFCCRDWSIAGRIFFFEKKKQKTFVCLAA